MKPSIVAAANPRDLFAADIVRFTEEAAGRLKSKHAFFRKNHAAAAFDRVDIIIR